MPVLIFFVLWGLLELFVLIMVADAFGALATIVFLMLAAFFGGAIIRRQRDDLTRQMTRKEKQATSTQIRETMYHLLAGVLLILPGFVSDFFALFLLLSPLRRIFGAALLRVFKPDLVVRGFGWHDVAVNVYEHEDTVHTRREDDGNIEGIVIDRKTGDPSR